jgi:ABC-2 type transport system permease protein
MKQILILMRQDLATALRDNILLYMIVAPLLLALVVRAFLPAVESAGITLAVSSEVDRQVIEGLKEYGDIEVYATGEEVRERVERIDAVPGIVMEDGKPVLLYEGNEPENIIESGHVVLAASLAGKRMVRFDFVSLGESSSIIREVIVLSLVMLALLLGGVVSGFHIIDEKDSKAVNALAVTPLNLSRYLTARSLIALIIAAVITFGTVLILSGSEINYLLLTVAVIASALLIALFCLLIGGLANNQISAIAVIKVLMPLYLAVPIISLFVSERLQAIFFPFPNYWQFQMLRSLLFGDSAVFGFWRPALFTVILSAVFLLLALKLTRGRLMPRGR